MGVEVWGREVGIGGGWGRGGGGGGEPAGWVDFVGVGPVGFVVVRAGGVEVHAAAGGKDVLR